jgi:HAD superfamily hydrolase (TIGR01509 family)
VERPGVIFDLDGVIVDSEGLQYEAYRRVLAGEGVVVSESEYAREWIANGQGPEYAVRTYGLRFSADDLRARKNPVYHALLRTEACLMPGAVDAIERLARDFPLAVATNSNGADTDFVLARFALGGHFAAVVTRECYAAPKPAPDAFRTAAGALGLPAERCVVIEDAYKGVLAASRAGCACIAVPNRFTADNDFRLATRVVASLADVTAALVESVFADG